MHACSALPIHSALLFLTSRILFLTSRILRWDFRRLVTRAWLETPPTTSEAKSLKLRAPGFSEAR